MKNLIFGLVLAMAALEAASAPRSFVERLKTDQPFFIAHRGIVDRAKGVRENTLASFEEAGKAKMQAIETDVRLTVDGALVCSHDASLKRVFGVDLNVEKATLEEVRKHPVPMFAEYLDICAKYDAVPFIETRLFPEVDDISHRTRLAVRGQEPVAGVLHALHVPHDDRPCLRRGLIRLHVHRQTEACPLAPLPDRLGKFHPIVAGSDLVPTVFPCCLLVREGREGRIRFSRVALELTP